MQTSAIKDYSKVVRDFRLDIKSIARRANKSDVTVLAVLGRMNQDTQHFSEATRLKVHKAVEEELSALHAALNRLMGQA